MAKLLTIGITSYNNEPFLSELLYTISKNLEVKPELNEYIDVIIYDDKSTNEDTIKTLIKYNHVFDVYFSKINNGTPTYGRNYILDQVDSKYVLFMDDDDNFICDLEDIVKDILNKNADIIVSDVMKIANDGKLIKSPFIYSNHLFSNKVDKKDYYKYTVHQTGIWSIYNVNFLNENNIRYRSDFRYEDNYFMTQIYLNYPRVEITRVKYYGWRINLSSFSNNNDSITNRIKIYDEILKFLATDVNNPVSPYLLYSIQNQTYGNILRSYPNVEQSEYKVIFNEYNKITKRHVNTINRLTTSEARTVMGKLLIINDKKQIRNFYTFNMLRNMYKVFRNKNKIKRKMLNSFTLLPIDENKMFITSQYGLYNDNSKYLYLDLKADEQYKDKKFVFAVKDLELAKHEDFINYNNKLKYYFHHYTAKEIVFNTWYSPEIKKRKNQNFTQLWHGIPIKKVHTDINTYFNTTAPHDRKNREKAIQMWDTLWSTNEYNTKIFQRLFSNVQIIEQIYPKTKWLMKNKTNYKLQEKLKQKYQLDNKQKYTLYAPTYRPYVSYIDLEKVDSLKLSNHKLIVHLHPLMRAKLINSENVEHIVLKDIDDIQEMILITDEVITDYSSIQYDYQAIDKNVILYQYDYELYNKIHGVYEEKYENNKKK